MFTFLVKGFCLPTLEKLFFWLVSIVDIENSCSFSGDLYLLSGNFELSLSFLVSWNTHLLLFLTLWALMTWQQKNRNWCKLPAMNRKWPGLQMVNNCQRGPGDWWSRQRKTQYGISTVQTTVKGNFSCRSLEGLRTQKSLDFMAGKREIWAKRNPRLLHPELMGEGLFLSNNLFLVLELMSLLGSIFTYPEMEPSPQPMPAGLYGVHSQPC